jgi:hypothetical protein
MPSKRCKGTPPQASSKRSRQIKFLKETYSMTPSPEIICHCQWPKFSPPALSHTMIRLLHHSGEKPSCLVFGPRHKTVYSNFFVQIAKAMKMQLCVWGVKRSEEIQSGLSAQPTTPISSFPQILPLWMLQWARKQPWVMKWRKKSGAQYLNSRIFIYFRR